MTNNNNNNESKTISQIRLSNHKRAFAESDVRINFQNAFLMNTNSIHYNRTRQLMSAYSAAGLVERTFRLVQANSHRLLTKSLSEQVVNLMELKGLIINTLAVGSIVASIVFFIEIVHWKYNNHRQMRTVSEEQ